MVTTQERWDIRNIFTTFGVEIAEVFLLAKQLPNGWGSTPCKSCSMFQDQPHDDF
jgi:hypothetical protein